MVITCLNRAGPNGEVPDRECLKRNWNTGTARTAETNKSVCFLLICFQWMMNAGISSGFVVSVKPKLSWKDYLSGLN